MTALYIILGIAVVIIILLICPVSVYIHYDGNTIFFIRYLFFKFHVMPQKKENKKEKEVSENSDNKKEIKEEKKNPLLEYKDEHGWEGMIDILKTIAEIIADVLKKISRHIVIKKLEVNLMFVGEDAADSAVKFGEICAVIFPVISLIENNVKKCNHKEDISPGFFAEKTEYELLFKAKIKPVFLVQIILSDVLKLILKLTKSVAKK